MNNSSKYPSAILVWLLILVCFVAYVSHVITVDTPGIVAVPGYEHGVGFCGIEFGVALHAEEDHYWHDKRHDITYVVNAGHLEDEEVLQLVHKAEVYCANLIESRQSDTKLPLR